MRLLNFLSDSVLQDNEILNILKNDCSKFLKELPKGRLLYREESSSLISGNFTKITTRDSRGNRTDCYKLINDWLIKNGFCSRISNVMFCTASNHSNIFGDQIVTVFPIGDYKYTFVKSVDFNMNNKSNGYFTEILNWCVRDEIYKLSNTSWQFLSQNEKEKIPLDKLKKPSKLKIYIPFHNGLIRKSSLKTTAEYFQLENKAKDYFVQNKNLSEAINNKYEIWFNCKAYYAVEPFTALRIFGID